MTALVPLSCFQVRVAAQFPKVFFHTCQMTYQPVHSTATTVLNGDIGVLPRLIWLAAPAALSLCGLLTTEDTAASTATADYSFDRAALAFLGIDAGSPRSLPATG